MVAATPGQPLVRTFFLSLPAVQRLDAVELLDSLGDADADTLAMQLAIQLHERPAVFGRALSLLQTLEVVVALIRAGHIDRGIGEAVDVEAEAQRLRRTLRGVHDTRQQGLAAAVQHTGGAAAFGITPATRDALANPGHPAAADTLRMVDRLARTAHGWDLVAVSADVFVLYRPETR